MAPGSSSVLAIVLAGGRGRRLEPLTRDRAKPAVPFGGRYRLVDFVLSNLVNGEIRKIVVLTQYKSHSLDRHISRTWRLSPELGNYVTSVPAQMRLGPRWFAGSADAIYQNLNLIKDEAPDHVLVFGADHIYRMDPRQFLAAHIEGGAAATVAGIRVPRSTASSFGIIDADAKGTVRRFLEKPADPPGLPGAPDVSLASMGNYIFRTDALLELLADDASDDSSAHDVGGNLLPRTVKGGSLRVYDFADNIVPDVDAPERGYWRDVGTVDAYFDAHMDLVAVQPVFNLYNSAWPIYSWEPPYPPAKFVFDEEGRRGHALDSMVSNGVIVSGGTVRQSVLSPGVRVETGALVEQAVLLDDVIIGQGAIVRHCIIDKQVVVPPGARVGVDPDFDDHHFMRSAAGVVVIAKRQDVPLP